MLCDRSLSFFHSFCHTVNRITDERVNGRRPNLAGTGKRSPSRSGWLLVVIRICARIPVFHFLHHWGIGHFPTFASMSVFSPFSYNQQPIWTKLGEMNDADECIHNMLIRIEVTERFLSLPPGRRTVCCQVNSHCCVNPAFIPSSHDNSSIHRIFHTISVILSAFWANVTCFWLC